MVALAEQVSKNAARILAHGQYWIDLFPPRASLFQFRSKGKYDAGISENTPYLDDGLTCLPYRS